MKIKKDRWDVVIIGAGPAGSSAARLIAEEGFDCLIIEKDKEPGLHNSCAGGIPYALAQKLKIDSHVIEKEIHGCVLHFNSGPKKWRKKHPLFTTVDRRVFDKYLAERAVKAGAELSLLTKVYDVKKGNDGLKVYTNNLKTGKKSCLSGKLVIFADGVNTLARRTFGFGFDKKLNHFAAALAYEMEAEENAFDEFELYFDSRTIPWGYYWIFPKKNTLNVGVDCLSSKIEDKLKACLDEFIGNHPLLKDKKKVRFTAGLIPVSLSRRLYSDSCLVVGDAGGMADPLTFGGIVYGIKGGELAGLACIEALKKGKYEAKSLAQYQRDYKRTKHYWWLKFLSLVSAISISLSNMAGRSLFPTLIKLYSYFYFHLPYRFTKNN